MKPAPARQQRIPSTHAETPSRRGKPLHLAVLCQQCHVSIPSNSSRSISPWVGRWAWVLLGDTGWGQGLLPHTASNTCWHTRGINT